MILVDTSVLIDFLKGQRNEQAALFKDIIARDIPFGFSAFTYQEVLQGARDEGEFEKLAAYMSTQTIYYVRNELPAYEKAAKMYFDLRRKGVTIRSTIDVLIALTATENRLYLLHNDSGFDAIARHLPELKVLTAF